jgi:hypothetical protein
MTWRAAVLTAVAVGLLFGVPSTAAAAVTTTVECTATAPARITRGHSSCTIIQPLGGTASCTIRTTASGSTAVKQRCTIRQRSRTHRNHATATLIIRQTGRWTQEAQQVITIEQGNVFRNNIASASERVVQSLTKHGAATAIDQSQESHQSINVCQGALHVGVVPNCRSAAGMRGNNSLSISQTLRQAQSADGAPVIAQLQNTGLATNKCSPLGDPTPIDDPTAHMCANADQNTTGANTSSLRQVYNQAQNVSDAATATQQQGGDPLVKRGGLDHQVNQDGGAPSQIHTDQDAFQDQAATNVGVLTQDQDPFVAKGRLSNQGSHPDNRWRGEQTSTQTQTEDGNPSGGTQSTLLEYFGVTSGDIRAVQIANQNGVTNTWGCPPPDEPPPPGQNSTCGAVMECTNAEPGPDLLAIVILQEPTCTRETVSGPD